MACKVSAVAHRVKSPMGETRVWSLGGEDPLEKGMTTYSSILSWRIPWMEEPGGLQSMGSQRIRHNWATNSRTGLRGALLSVTSYFYLATFKVLCYLLRLSLTFDILIVICLGVDLFWFILFGILNLKLGYLFPSSD